LVWTERVVRERLERILLRPIAFEVDKVEMAGTGGEVVDEIMAALKEHPTVPLKIEGHSTHPNAHFATVPSKGRADSVKATLQAAGRPPAAPTGRAPRGAAARIQRSRRRW
ncbi:unnamed protein product, partial [Polarella glacialis]